MNIFSIHLLSVLISLLILNQLFIRELVVSKTYISTQLRYFLSKSIIISIITYFFCFFYPLNSIKFILSSLIIFIVFHFIEAIVIQIFFNLKDSNEK